MDEVDSMLERLRDHVSGEEATDDDDDDDESILDRDDLNTRSTGDVDIMDENGSSFSSSSSSSVTPVRNDI